MAFLTLISLIIFIILLVVRIILRQKIKKKLESISGFEGLYKKGNSKGTVIGKISPPDEKM